jgi:hypothetical protein
MNNENIAQSMSADPSSASTAEDLGWGVKNVIICAGMLGGVGETLKGLGITEKGMRKALAR